MPKQYKILRSVSVYPNTYESFKDACIKERKPISEVIENLMKDYAAGKRMVDNVNTDVDVFRDND